MLTADTDDELDKMYEDDRLNALFESLFNPVDDMFDASRDQDRFAKVLADIQALGYSRDAARDYLNTELVECHDEAD